MSKSSAESKPTCATSATPTRLSGNVPEDRDHLRELRGRLLSARLRRDGVVAGPAARDRVGAYRRGDRLQRHARRESRRLLRSAARESAHGGEPRSRRRQLALLALEARGLPSHLRQRRRLRHRHQPRGPRPIDAASPARVDSSLAALVRVAAVWRDGHEVAPLR